MSADKYLCIFLRQMKAIVYIYTLFDGLTYNVLFQKISTAGFFGLNPPTPLEIPVKPHTFL